MFFISTTRKLSVNRKDLQALVGSGANLGSGPPSCTIPQQLTMYYQKIISFIHLVAAFSKLEMNYKGIGSRTLYLNKNVHYSDLQNSYFKVSLVTTMHRGL